MTRPTGKKPRKMNPRQARFVEEYLKDGNHRRAALAAGYPEGTASNNSVAQSGAVKTAIEDIRGRCQAAATYNLQTAMQRIADGLSFALETGNATAYAKLLELESKLHGLLIEKHQHQVASFSLNINGVRRKPPTDIIAGVPSDSEIAVVSSTSSSSDDDDGEEDVFS